MALTSDVTNIVEVITINNLSNLTLPAPIIILPAGLELFFETTVKNNLDNNLGLESDIQQLLKTLITDNQITFK